MTASIDAAVETFFLRCGRANRADSHCCSYRRARTDRLALRLAEDPVGFALSSIIATLASYCLSPLGRGRLGFWGALLRNTRGERNVRTWRRGLRAQAVTQRSAGARLSIRASISRSALWALRRVACAISVLVGAWTGRRVLNSNFRRFPVPVCGARR